MRKGKKNLGDSAAIVLQFLAHMVRENAISRKGKKWVRIKLDTLAAQYSYLGCTAVDNAVKRLIDFGACEVQNQNKEFGRKKCDRTRWYHVPRKWIDLTAKEPRCFHPPIAAEIGIAAALIHYNFARRINEAEENCLESAVLLTPL